MERERVSSQAAPAAIGPYSQAIRAGGVLYLSGQIALDPESGEMVGGGEVVAESKQVMKNLGEVLRAGGSDFTKVLKSTIYLTDLNDFAAVNTVYASFFEGMEPPARATVQVAALPRAARVEIDMMALSDAS